MYVKVKEVACIDQVQVGVVIALHMVGVMEVEEGLYMELEVMEHKSVLVVAVIDSCLQAVVLNFGRVEVVTVGVGVEVVVNYGKDLVGVNGK